MQIPVPLVNLQIEGQNIWLAKDANGHLFVAPSLAKAGDPTETRVVEATLTEFPNGVIDVPDEQVRFKGGE